MSGEQLQQHARDAAARLDEVTTGRPFTPNLEVWKVRSKVFLIVTEGDPSLQIVTVKVDPYRGNALRSNYSTITTGRYLDKRHWISVGSGPEITEALIEDLVQSSYDLADDRPVRQRHL